MYSMLTDGVQLHVQRMVPVTYEHIYTLDEWEEYEEKCHCEVEPTSVAIEDRGRNKSHPKFNFTIQNGPVIDSFVKYARSDGKNRNAPIFNNVRKGVYKQKFLFDQSWKPRAGQRLVVIDPGQINMLTCLTYTISENIAQVCETLANGFNPDDPHAGDVDAFALEESLRRVPVVTANNETSGSGEFVAETSIPPPDPEMVCIKTRQFYQDTLVAAHRRRKHGRKWAAWRTRKKAEKLLTRENNSLTEEKANEIAAKLVGREAAVYGELPPAVQEAQDRRSSVSPCLYNGDIEDYARGLEVYSDTTKQIMDFWNQSVHAHKAWERARRRRQFWDALINRLTPNEDDIIIRGDAFMGRNLKKGDYQNAGGRPPIKEFIRQAARRKRVVLLPEWFTSATHSLCGHNMARKLTWRSQRSYAEQGQLRSAHPTSDLTHSRTGTGGHVYVKKLKMAFRLDSKLAYVRTMDRQIPSTGRNHLLRTGTLTPSNPLLHAKHSLPTAAGSTRRICIRLAREKGVISKSEDPPEVTCAQVQVQKPLNGVSFCARCNASVHRDGNACCNLLKAFFWYVQTGYRPVHFRVRSERERIRQQEREAQEREIAPTGAGEDVLV